MHTGVRCLRILVVDDEPLIRWSIAETLGAAGHRVFEAADAASARRLLDQTPELDLVLLDLRLPDSSDLALLGDVRRKVPNTSVILMTAFGTAEITADALRMGALRVLNKPFNMHDLEAFVQSL